MVKLCAVSQIREPVGDKARVIILSVVCCSLLAACASVRDVSWPEDIPEIGYFQRAYDNDEVNQDYQNEAEYLEWVVNFYEGSMLYPTGWHDVELAILDSVAPQDHAHQQQQLQLLAADIAAEWAKHNDVRLIDNRLLSLWGSMLQLAQDEQQLSRTINVIGDDIAAILALQLPPVDITPGYYEEMLKIQLFDDF